MKNVKTNLMLILTSLIWGLAFVAQSVSMDYIGPFTFNFARNLIGALFLIPCIAFLDKANAKTSNTQKKKMDAPEKKKLLIGGLCCGTILFVASNLQQFGIMNTTVGKAGFITALYIIIVPVLGLLFRKRVSLTVWISVFVAVVGMYFLCINEGFSISKGDFLVILCAFGFSIHILVIDHFSSFVDCVRMSCIQFFTCGILSALCMFIFEKPTISSMLAAWGPILYAGVLSCGVAYTLQIVAQKNTDPTIAALILSLESVFAVLAGWLILSQSLNAKEIFGCILVFAAIVLAQVPSKKAT